MLRNQVKEPWPQYIAQGLVSICPPVEAELMVAVRSEKDFEPFFGMLTKTFTWCPAIEDPWPKILGIQRDLVKIGHHRGPSPMDILIALIAHERHLTLIHVDEDFTAIAKVRPGMAMIRVDEQ